MQWSSSRLSVLTVLSLNTPGAWGLGQQSQTLCCSNKAGNFPMGKEQRQGHCCLNHCFCLLTTETRYPAIGGEVYCGSHLSQSAGCRAEEDYARCGVQEADVSREELRRITTPSESCPWGPSLLTRPQPLAAGSTSPGIQPASKHRRHWETLEI